MSLRSEMRLGWEAESKKDSAVRLVGGRQGPRKRAFSFSWFPSLGDLHLDVFTAPSGRVSSLPNRAEPKKRYAVCRTRAAGATPTNPQGWPYLHAWGSTKVDMQMPARAVIPLSYPQWGRGRPSGDF